MVLAYEARMTEDSRREKENKEETSRKSRKGRRVQKLKGLTTRGSGAKGGRGDGRAPPGSLAELAQLDSRGKGGDGSLYPSFIQNEVSLPPEVEGNQRGELVLVLGPLVVSNSKLTSSSFKEDGEDGGQPTQTTISYRFWGQEDLHEGNYLTLQALKGEEMRAGDHYEDKTVKLCIPIRCSPSNFTRYLKDSQPLQITAFVAGVGAAGCEVDLQELELKKPLRGDFNLTTDNNTESIKAGSLGVYLEVDYSLISSFELNEHIANTDMSLPLFPVSDLELDDQDIAKLVSGASAVPQPGEGEEGAQDKESEKTNEDKALFGWGPSKDFKRTAGQAEAATKSTFLNDDNNSRRGPSVHSIVEPTWDSVLARAQKLSNAMKKAIGGRDERSLDFPSGSMSLAPFSHAQAEREGANLPQDIELSPCPSITSSVEDVVIDFSAAASEEHERPREEPTRGGPEQPTPSEKSVLATVVPAEEKVVDFTISSPPQESRKDEKKIQMALRVKDVHLVSKDLRPGRVIIVVKCALGNLGEGGGQFTFTAHSIKQQGRLFFQISEEDLKGMSGDKLLLSIELWQIQDKRHTVFVDAASSKLIGLSTFCVKDILENSGHSSTGTLVKGCHEEEEEVAFSLSKSILDLLQGSNTGRISVKLEFSSLALQPPRASVPEGAAAREEARSTAPPETSSSCLVDHVFEVTVQRASGLKLLPDLKYFLSYTFQSSEDAEPLCTKPVAPRSIMDINARACHTITLPQSETVLMNIGSFHGQNLEFDLRSVSGDTDRGTPWHATGSLDFMELVEMTCSGDQPLEKIFLVPLKLNEELYEESLRSKSSPALSLVIKYGTEEHEVASQDPPKQLAIAPGAEAEDAGEPLHLPERNVLAKEETELLEFGEQDIEVLEDARTNMDIEDFEITGSNSMKAKIDFSIGKICGLKTMMTSAEHGQKDNAVLRAATKFGPNTFVNTKFAPKDSYFQEFLPETCTDFKAENWIPDFEFFKSFNMYLSPSTVNLMTKENIELELWHYTPGRQASVGGSGAGKKVLLGVCKIPWSNVLTCPRGICGLHTILCPKLQTPIGAIEVNATLQMRSYMLQNSSILESCGPVREMLPEEFVQHNKKSIDLFTGRYANFVVAVDNVTVSSSDTLHFNHKLRYCIALSVNGFMGETISKATHPKPSAHQRMWERLNLSHKAFKSFKVDKFFVAAINNSPLTVRVLECDENRPDVEIAFGDIDLSQLLLEKNSVSETSRMVSGTYTLVPIKRDYIEIRVRVKILLKGTSYCEFPQGQVEAEGAGAGEEPVDEDSALALPRVDTSSELRRSLDALKSLKASRKSAEGLQQVLRLEGSEGGDEEVLRLPEVDDIDTDPEEDMMMAEVSEVISIMRSQELAQEVESNDVLVCVEDALHMNFKLAGKTSPNSAYAYVSFMWPDSSGTACSSLAECIPEAEASAKHRCKWYFTKHLSFKDFSVDQSSEGSQQSFILQVWARHVKVSQSIEFSELDEPVRPDPESDTLIGSAVVDVNALFSGLGEIHGWYNVLDYNQNCCGQLKVRISLLNARKHHKDDLEEGQVHQLDDSGDLGQAGDLAMVSSLGLELEPETGDRPEGLGAEEVGLQLAGEGAGATPGYSGDAGVQESATNFRELTRSICQDLGNLEEKILSLDPSGDCGGAGDDLGSYGRSLSLEEIYLNQIEFSVDNFRHSPSAPPLEEAPLAGKDDRTHTPPLTPQGGAQAEEKAAASPDPAIPEEPKSRGMDATANAATFDRPGFNFDRIARILSAG
ncbi:hypothetical protein A3770_04p29410 [Chloropicon primus]|uniref:C2CD3 N-terminal C2 domain-containing protein n=2 Tax=Chloropicon primus TaxID=1764295 RepID=A0A5B8MIY8_9CHLO|nr:hypothetical protein A3770_04p29410 [Chloropicon primus]|eukprot:QDZ20423.1 hypothetical protein A3770_04p29410 [Chloropicon primus]